MKRVGTVTINTEKVERLIVERGLKKSWVAREMGINPGTLSTVLKRGYCRLTTVRAIVRVLKVSEAEIAA